MKNTFTTSFDALPAGRAAKVIQIHPGVQCNLTCRHCHSGSAPSFKGGLDVYRLQQVVEELAGVGYNAISVSGGEPFLYRPLAELLSHTRSLGFFNSITTNAMLLGSDRAKKILSEADLIAISVEGKEEQHDALRNFKGAFKKMEEGVQMVKDHVPYFGFIHTLFPDNWEIMHWLVQFALSHKAKLLHFHPLEMAGSAAANPGSVSFTPEALHKIYTAFHYMKEAYGGQLFMQLDLLHRDYIMDNPSFMFQQAAAPQLTVANFSGIFKELIIDEEGDIIPVSHDCSKYFTLGNIYDGVSCKQMIKRFMEKKLDDVMEVFQTTHDFIREVEEIELVNWNEMVVYFSQQLFDVQSAGLFMKRKSKELV